MSDSSSSSHSQHRFRLLFILVACAAITVFSLTNRSGANQMAPAVTTSSTALPLAAATTSLPAESPATATRSPMSPRALNVDRQQEQGQRLSSPPRRLSPNHDVVFAKQSPASTLPNLSSTPARYRSAARPIISGAAIEDSDLNPRPLSCHSWNAKGTIFGSIVSTTRSNFEGAQVVKELPPSMLSLFSAASSGRDGGSSEMWRDFEVRSLCQDYVVTRPKHFTHTPGCVRNKVNNLLAVRYFNFFDPCQVADLMRATNTPNATRRCVVDARQRVVDTMKTLEAGSNPQLVSAYREFRRMWLQSDAADDNEEARDENSSPLASASPSAFPVSTNEYQIETNFGAFRLDQNLANNETFMAALSKRERADVALQQATDRQDEWDELVTQRIMHVQDSELQCQQQQQRRLKRKQRQRSAPRKKPTLPLPQRRRILVNAAMQLPRALYPRHPISELQLSPESYKHSIRSFLTVAKASIDELHIVTDYQVGEWEAFAKEVRESEAERRRLVRRRFRPSDFLQDAQHQQRARGTKQTASNYHHNKFSDADAGASTMKRLPDEVVDYDDYGVPASDGKLCAKVFVHDVSTWRVAFDNPIDMRPLSSRVFKINHFLQEVLGKDEHDGTIAMVIQADTRDVMYTRNPFDALAELRLNRYDNTSSGGGSSHRRRDLRPSSLMTSRSRSGSGDAENYPLRGIVIGAEDQSHQCNYRQRTETPNWEKYILGDGGVKRTLWDDRMMPDRELFPILCSGFIAMSLEAGRDFQRLFVRTLATHRQGPKGMDQGAAAVAVYHGVPAAAFPHDVFILNNPDISPLRHFHYFNSDLFQVYLPTQTYITCAGYPLAIAHQRDRKAAADLKFKKMLEERFDPNNPW